MKVPHIAVPLAFAVGISALSVPENLKKFYNRVHNGKCTGGTVLKDGFYSEEGGPKNFAYCQDSATGVLYIHGDGSELTNMDVDCDGDQTDQGDGRCKSSTDTQDSTAFADQVHQYSQQNCGNVSDVNSNFVPYVVFGNQGTKRNYTTFDPEAYGMQPLSVMAVLCGANLDKLVYGVWADTNGDDGPPSVGEASIALATACYGTNITGNNGHDPNDVLYIGFPGSQEDTVQTNATWGAKNFSEFENSIQTLGNKLIKRLS